VSKAWQFLLPDISFAGYLLGPRIGAIAYSLAHSHVGAVVLTLFGVAFPGPPALIAGLICWRISALTAPLVTG